MIRKLGYIFLSVVCSTQMLLAQLTPSTADVEPPKYCKTGVPNMAPKKVVSANYIFMPDYGMKSTSQSININGDVQSVNWQSRIKASIKIPVLNLETYKLFVEFKYTTEKLRFEHIPDPLGENILYSNLDEKRLKSFGVGASLVKLINHKMYLATRVDASWSGDYSGFMSGNSRYLSTGWWIILVTKLGKKAEIGGGFSFNYDLGYYTVYPLLLYNQTFTDKWGIEAVLPVKVKARFNATKTTYFYLGYEIGGRGYMVDVGDIRQNVKQHLKFSFSEARFGLEMKQKVVSLMWCGFDMGYRRVLGMRFNDTDIKRRQPVIQSNVVGGGFYADFTVYFVPPDGFIERKSMKKEKPNTEF